MAESDQELSEQVQDIMSSDINKGENVQIVEIRDASTELAKTLIQQMGSDDEFIREGAVDIRRFSNIEDLDVFWISYFNIIPRQYGGNFARAFASEYMNTRVSLNALNKKLVVHMQRAIAGKDDEKKKTDTRSFLEKHVTKRNQKPSQELYDV